MLSVHGLLFVLRFRGTEPLPIGMTTVLVWLFMAFMASWLLISSTSPSWKIIPQSCPSGRPPYGHPNRLFFKERGLRSGAGFSFGPAPERSKTEVFALCREEQDCANMLLEAIIKAVMQWHFSQ